MIPGEIDGPDGVVVLNAGRSVQVLRVLNAGDRPVQVGSHFHFAETNDALVFDRPAARGFRLDIAAGTSLRFEPGIELVVSLVAFAGGRYLAGFRGHVAGAIDG